MHGVSKRITHNVGLQHITRSVRSCLLSSTSRLLIGVNVHYAASGEWGIECSVSPPFNQSVYLPSLEANISVNLANYGGATNLDLFVFCSLLSRNSFLTSCSTWTYWPVYFGSVTPGSSIPIHSQVGDAGFDDSFLSIDGDINATWGSGVCTLGSKGHVIKTLY
jgi:hypothetical protein